MKPSKFENKIVLFRRYQNCSSFTFLFLYSEGEATLLSFLSLSSILKLWRCVSDLLTTCRDFWKGLKSSEGVNFIRLYFTTVFYLEGVVLTLFYVRNNENQTEFVLPYERKYFLFLQVSLLFTFLTGIFLSRFDGENWS